MPDWLKQLRNPPAAFRPAPFWAWNSKLDSRELVRQVDEFARAGLGGFFMHVRYGLETDYMSPEFMDCVKAVVAAARKRRLEAWLYDEDRWPSGFAGGMVTKAPANRIKFITMEKRDAIDGRETVFSAVVDGDRARDVRRLAPGEATPPGATLLVFTPSFEPDDPRFNNTAYLDTMSPAAVRKFIEVTHEAYKAAVGGEFGNTIPGIFTDEPNFGHFHKRKHSIPWTDGLDEKFRKRFGYDLMDHLPELWLDVEGATPSKARHDYRQLVTELYVDAFSKQIGDWCAANGLESTGHELSEESLPAQIDQVGACMPHYEHFQRPGIDILMDRQPEVLTTKQCVSVASQLGRPRVLSELYGCTGWDATFEMYKHIGDWHQVLGVNHFCPHLSWYSMAGGAKRDYPAGIFYQSPWWPDHTLLADYFARLSLALSQGNPVRHVAVIHPIESAWLVHKKLFPGQSQALSESLDKLCFNLLDNQYDFDFADESMLPKHAAITAGADGGPARLVVGQMSYRVVIVPESLTLRASTVALLEKFADAGGRLVFVGQSPTMIDCETSDRLARLIGRSVRVSHSAAGLEQAMASAGGLGSIGQEVRISTARRNEAAAVAWVHLRKIEQGEVLFVHQRDRSRGYLCKIEWAGGGAIREIDPLTGATVDVAGVEESGAVQTFACELGPTGSRLFLRTPGTASKRRPKAAPPAAVETLRVPLSPTWDYSLDEPNAMTLDYARVRVGDEKAFRDRKLIWMHERDIRKVAGFRDNAVPLEQPYIWLKSLSPKAVPVEIEFEVVADVATAAPLAMAIEHPERFEISVNGRLLKPAGGEEAALADGEQNVDWFVDRSIRIVPLKGVKLRKGINTVRLRTDYREHHWLEEVYLLGRFGVRTAGDRTVMTAQPKKLAVGDWTAQGLAMFSGSATYRQTVRAPKLEKGERFVLKIDRPACTLLRVAVNGRPIGQIGWAPWEIDVTAGIRPGVANRIEITVVSSRRNLLGPLHYVPVNPLWSGPGEFRSEPGSRNFMPGYSLVPYGLLGQVSLAKVKK